MSHINAQCNGRNRTFPCTSSCLVFWSLFLSPVLKFANRLAAMGSGRISGSSFFWMHWGRRKKGINPQA